MKAKDYESLLAAYQRLEEAHKKLKARNRGLKEKLSEAILALSSKRAKAAERKAKRKKKSEPTGPVRWS